MVTKLVEQKKKLISLWDAGGVTTAQANSDREALKNALIDDGNYVYESLTSQNTPCFDSGCTRFNLYYKREANPSVPVQIKSKHQQ